MLLVILVAVLIVAVLIVAGKFIFCSTRSTEDKICRELFKRAEKLFQPEEGANLHDYYNRSQRIVAVIDDWKIVIERFPPSLSPESGPTGGLHNYSVFVYRGGQKVAYKNYSPASWIWKVFEKLEAAQQQYEDRLKKSAKDPGEQEQKLKQKRLERHLSNLKKL